jgi:hypothetical protein
VVAIADGQLMWRRPVWRKEGPRAANFVQGLANIRIYKTH